MDNSIYEMTDAELDTEIIACEKRSGMSSEEFMKHWKEGSAPDTYATNAWAILLKARDNLHPAPAPSKGEG